MLLAALVVKIALIVTYDIFLLLYNMEMLKKDFISPSYLTFSSVLINGNKAFRQFRRDGRQKVTKSSVCKTEIVSLLFFEQE